jgi:hypothetical protein
MTLSGGLTRPGERDRLIVKFMRDRLDLLP